jgi:hypothetical protein
MSRSRKKIAIIKDRNPFFKRLNNRLIRKSGHGLTLQDPDSILLPKKYEFVNPYNICDYKHMIFTWYTKGSIRRNEQKEYLEELLKKAKRK